MSPGGDRAADAERYLVAHGVANPRVTAVGASGEIAAVRISAADAGLLATLAPGLRELGFRYVALDPPANDEADS